MGRITIPTYRLEVWDNTPLAAVGQRLFGPKTYSWDRRYGRPTVQNLERKILSMADSMKLGGVNAHISKALGYVPLPKRAQIVNQRTGAVVASWKASPFQVF